MPATTTMSISIPIKLSIIVNEFIEKNGITRSELFKRAISEYINKEKRAEEIIEVLSKMMEDIQEIKRIIK